MEKSFDEIYEQIYNKNYEVVEKDEKKRRKTWIIKTIAKIGLVIILMTIPLFMIIKRLFEGVNVLTTPIIVMPILGLTIICIIKILSKSGNFKDKKMFKLKVINPLIKNIDENLNYYPAEGIRSEEYRRGEFEDFNIYTSEDKIEGLIDHKYEMRMAEVHTKYESTDDNGNKYIYTVFHGICGITRCNKNIGVKLKILLDAGKIGNFFKEKTQVELDSEEFEKYFDVYTENKIIAMQILTSDVMETLIEAVKKYKLSYELVIKGEYIYIRCHTGEVFEPKMFTNSLDYSMLKKYYDIIEFIFKVSREINKVIENTEI